MAKDQQVRSGLVIQQPQSSNNPALPASSVVNSNIVSVQVSKAYGVTAGSIPFVGSNLFMSEVVRYLR